MAQENGYGCGMTAALLTDKYELTMLAAALRDGSAHRRTTFEVFARRLPEGRRYGVVAGTARFVEALAEFMFDNTALASLSDFLDDDTLAYLADYRLRGDVDGYAKLAEEYSEVTNGTGQLSDIVKPPKIEGAKTPGAQRIRQVELAAVLRALDVATDAARVRELEKRRDDLKAALGIK